MLVNTFDGISVFPIDYNSFLNIVTHYKEDVRYYKEYTISESLFEEIVYEAKRLDTFVVFDMDNVVSYPTRAFKKLKGIGKQIMILNVNYDKLVNMINEDVEDMVWNDKYRCYATVGVSENTISKAVDVAKTYREEYEKKIINSLIDFEECHLESSGLISNYFVNTKKLFYDTNQSNYIFFRMAGMIFDDVKNNAIDAFVSTSKNGAVIASVLAGLLNVKEVHLIGVGPKYAMELRDSIDCIKRNKRYAYIFDFMCTGTEFKIVSALINSKEAFLPYAAGIARYSGIERKEKSTKVVVLKSTEQLGVDYKVAGASR